MLFFDESKVIEKAIGEDATRMLSKVFERYDETARKELATRNELLEAEMRIKAELTAELYKTKAEIIKWTIGLIIAQTAVLLTFIKM